MDQDTSETNEDEIFISESESEHVSPLKKRKTGKYESVSDSETEFSDWEDIPLDIPEVLDSFNITIGGHEEGAKKKKKLKDAIKNKQKRTTLHYLGMISYMMHAHQRNKWLTSKVLLKKLKKLLPDSLINTRFKKYKRALKKRRQCPHDGAVKNEVYSHFIYIVKYLNKWFRLNYKCESNGLRVLGYLPKSSKAFMNMHEYFPKTSEPITSLKSLISVAKTFKHNRDTGAQIFTALLRSLGFQSRLVFSLPLLSTNTHTALQPKLDHEKLHRNKDFDLLYPYFWTEVVNPVDESEVFVIDNISFFEESKRIINLRRLKGPTISKMDLPKYYTNIYFPQKSQFNQMSMHYVVAIDNNNLMMDVSPRYMQDISYRWFNKLDLRTELGRAAMLFQSVLRYVNKENTYSIVNNLELDTLRLIALLNYNVPPNFSSMKRSPNLVTKSTLRYNEIIEPNVVPICTVKMDKMSLGEPVFFKNSILVGKSENQWKFLGRSIKEDQLNSPIKVAKNLSRRTISRRNLFNMNILKNSSELNDTRLYSFNQTCPYIKLKITRMTSGLRIPRNEYGNIEIYKSSMVPEQCSWVTLSNIENILSEYGSGKLDCPISDKVEYVAVVTGFSFTSRGQAIPIKQGVLVLEQQEVLAKKLWLYGKIKNYQSENRDRRQRTFNNWNEMLRRLRIKSIVEEKYGTDM